MLEETVSMSQSHEVTLWAEAYFLLAGLGLGLMVKKPERVAALAIDEPNQERGSEEQLTSHFFHRSPELFLRSEMETFRQQANGLTEVDLRLRTRFSLHLRW